MCLDVGTLLLIELIIYGNYECIYCVWQTDQRQFGIDDIDLTVEFG
jgi:hypothetical protein